MFSLVIPPRLKLFTMIVSIANLFLYILFSGGMTCEDGKIGAEYDEISK